MIQFLHKLVAFWTQRHFLAKVFKNATAGSILWVYYITFSNFYRFSVYCSKKNLSTNAVRGPELQFLKTFMTSCNNCLQTWWNNYLQLVVKEFRRLRHGCQMAYFQTKNPNLGNFWVTYNGSCWHILRPLRIFCGYMVYFSQVLVSCTKKNLATSVSATYKRKWPVTVWSGYDEEPFKAKGNYKMQI
jgi:hypothetical protein